MDVVLRGNSPSTLTAGIMLLTRARQIGYRLNVSIVGDSEEIHPVPGPAVVYAPVLASCGVGRDKGSGATVVVSGPPGAPTRITLTPHGVGGWFEVSRSGKGHHPATQAYLRLDSDERAQAREQSRALREVLAALGSSTDPGVLDVLFGAPVPPLLRIAVALRAGRALSGRRNDSVTRHLAGEVTDALDPLSSDTPVDELIASWEAGELQWLLNRVSGSVRDRLEAWVNQAIALAKEDGGRDLALLTSLAELLSNLVQLPVHSILPPLGAAEDSVAVGLGPALTAEGEGDAARQLQKMFRFLGGRFVAKANNAMLVSEVAAPPKEDVVGSWEWFCSEVRVGRKRADVLWGDIFNPVQ